MRDDEQRRLEERTDCDFEARVELSDRLAIACRIKDLTPAAFRIQIVDAIHLPEEFDLLIPVVEGTFQRYRARMAWRRGDMAGGEILDPPKAI